MLLLSRLLHALPTTEKERERLRISALATQAEIDEASRNLANLAREVSVCEDVAKALIETDQRWWRPVMSTHYQKARDGVMDACRAARRELREMLRDTRRGDLIRGEAEVKSILKCCKECPRKNRERQARHEPFACMVQLRAAVSSGTAFRFQLDQEGQIREQA